MLFVHSVHGDIIKLVISLIYHFWRSLLSAYCDTVSLGSCSVARLYFSTAITCSPSPLNFCQDSIQRCPDPVRCFEELKRQQLCTQAIVLASQSMWSVYDGCCFIPGIMCIPGIIHRVLLYESAVDGRISNAARLTMNYGQSFFLSFIIFMRWMIDDWSVLTVLF